MSKLQVDEIVNKEDTGSVSLPKGAVVTGVITATTYHGDGSALSGTGVGANDSVNTTGIITASSGSFSSVDISGNLSVGGTITKEDVTNVDSVGVITARSGVVVSAGGVNIVGVTTTKGGLTTQKMLKEEVNVTAGKLSDNTNIYLENGCVHIFTTTESTTSTPAIKYSSSVNLKDRMSVGESVVVTLITTANASAYSANITIDGDAVTENWISGSAPSDGGSSGVDIHTFTIIKVASSGTTDQQLTVIANQSKTS